MRHLSGWLKDRPDHRDRLYSFPFFRTPLPREADLRAMCSRVEDQAELGSCTANASTSAMEFLYRKQGKDHPEFSRLFLYYATRVWIAKGEATDDCGAMIRDVMKALAKFGTCVETAWPYNLDDYHIEPSEAAKKDAQTHQIIKYYRLKGLAGLKACLASGYPAVGGFSVPNSFMQEEVTKTGLAVYPTPEDELRGGHAVLFVGYDDVLRRLIFQNSWGTAWGDQGFGYLPYEFVVNNLANDFWTIQTMES